MDLENAKQALVDAAREILACALAIQNGTDESSGEQLMYALEGISVASKQLSDAEEQNQILAAQLPPSTSIYIDPIPTTSWTEINDDGDCMLVLADGTQVVATPTPPEFPIYTLKIQYSDTSSSSSPNICDHIRNGLDAMEIKCIEDFKCGSKGKWIGEGISPMYIKTTTVKVWSPVIICDNVINYIYSLVEHKDIRIKTISAKCEF
jgi:hypothetical protein